MPILSINRDTSGEVSNTPNIVSIHCNDSLSTILTPGYLNNNNLMGNVISPKDEVHVVFANNGHGIFGVQVSGLLITLFSEDIDGIVELPVTNNFYAVYDSSVGEIKNGNLPGTAITKIANFTLNNVASVVIPTVSGNFAVFNDTAGTIADSGSSLGNAAVKAVSDNSKNVVSSYNNSTSITPFGAGTFPLAIFSNTTGAIKNLQKAFSFGTVNGNLVSSLTITDANITASSIIITAISFQDTNIYVQNVTVSSGSAIVTLSDAVGIINLNYLAICI